MSRNRLSGAGEYHDRPRGIRLTDATSPRPSAVHLASMRRRHRRRRLDAFDDAGQAQPGRSGAEHRGVAVDQGRLCQRHPEVRAVANLGSRETGRRDADDREERAVETDRPSDRRRVGAESLPPGRVAQDNHRRLARLTVGGREEPASRARTDAERGEVVRRSPCRRRCAAACARHPCSCRASSRCGRRRSATGVPGRSRKGHVFGIGERAAVLRGRWTRSGRRWQSAAA